MCESIFEAWLEDKKNLLFIDMERTRRWKEYCQLICIHDNNLEYLCILCIQYSEMAGNDLAMAAIREIFTF